MKRNTVDWRAMGLKGMPGRGSGKPGSWVLVSAGEGGRCRAVEFSLEI